MSHTIPAIMRAWTHTSTGSPSSVLILSNNIPVPIITPDELLVRISHASLSPGAAIMIHFCPFLFRATPAIPELDFSGTIVSVGDAVPASRGLLPGVPVFGSLLVGPHISKGKGALAEYIAISAASVVKKPESVSFEQAAGLGVSACTAITLLESAKLKKGDRVLINGASGGVGTMVVQLAVDAVGETGEVVAICSEKNVETMKKLGAKQVHDYQSLSPIHQYLASRYSENPFDSVIDAFGIQDFYTHSASYLAPGKKFVTVGIAFEKYTLGSVLYASSLMLRNSLLPRFLGGPPRDYAQIGAFTTPEALEKERVLVEDGKLEVVVDSCWKMEDALKAYEKMESKRARGKIIVKVQLASG